ncbi:MAG: hypothetical protein Q4G13_03635 [Moraxella sp.]|nr:hypothetical protein [Moraxella sp.]
MMTVSSQRLQTKFGEISDIVKGREPVVITQYKRPTMIVFAYEDGMELMRLAAKMRFIQRLEERAKAVPAATEEEMQAISKMIEEEREVVYQKKASNKVSDNEPK